jgi:hypothetical protein
MSNSHQPRLRTAFFSVKQQISFAMQYRVGCGEDYAGGDHDRVRFRKAPWPLGAKCTSLTIFPIIIDNQEGSEVC